MNLPLVKRKNRRGINRPSENNRKTNYQSINQFGLLTLGIALVAIVVIFMLFHFYGKKTGEGRLIKDGSALCTLITDVVRQELFIENQNKDLNLLNYVAREKELIYCLILNDQQVPLLQLGRQIPDQNSQISLNSQKTDYLLTQEYEDPTTKEIIYEFSKPVYLEGKKVGLVKIGLGLSRYVYLNQDRSYFMGVIALAILGLVLLIYFLVKRLLSPLYKIDQDLTKMIIEKQEYPKIEISVSGEIGQLAQRFNDILQGQQKKHRELGEYNTELEVANKILHYEKLRIRAILDNLKIGLVFIDSTGKAIMANQIAHNLLKVDESNYQGKPWEEFLENQSPKLAKFYRRFLQKENIYTHDFYEMKAQSGDTQIILGHDCFYLLDKEDKPLGMLWAITDITSQKQAESSRNEFINHVAHELKTPLTTLRSYSEMLLDNEISDEQNKREFVNSINKETIRLSRLINNLLNISKIETGCLKLTQTMIKTDKLLSDCYQTVRQQAISKNIHFTCDIADKMPNLSLDKDLIEVAILNLLTNAIKYTPESGKVTLQGIVENEHIVIKVIDSGYGIEESELDQVFDKFFRSARQEITKESGTGLGLALAKNIVQLHRGDIKVESVIGSGSSFSLILPKEEVFI